jgi:hypothetical protein
MQHRFARNVAVDLALHDPADLASARPTAISSRPAAISAAKPMLPRSTLIGWCNRMRPAPWFVKAEGHAPSPACS